MCLSTTPTLPMSWIYWCNIGVTGTFYTDIIFISIVDRVNNTTARWCGKGYGVGIVVRGVVEYNDCAVVSWAHCHII